MQALRLNEVLARVVAWHNRHPLARRINPTQVHSIGAVVLPFATDTLGAAASADVVLLPDQATAVAARPLTVSELLDMAPAATAPPVRQALPTAPAGPAETDALEDDVLATLDSAAAAETAAALDVDVEANADAGAAADTEADVLAAAMANAMAEAAAKPLPDRAPGPSNDPAVAATPAADLATAAEDDPFALAEADMAAEAAALAANAALQPAPMPVPVPDSPPPVDSVDLALSLTPPQPAATPADAPPDTPSDLLPDTPHAAPPAAALAPPPAPATSAASGPGWWLRLLARLRSAKPARFALQPVFSRSFVWPLRTGRVARWARQHGQVQALAPADWPHRLVDVDAPLRAAARQRGLALDVQLHLLTAAIGVGDRRIRLLIGADGQILGPRAYSRSRVGAAAGVLVLAAAASGWALRPKPAAPDRLASAAAALAADVTSAASAASVSASAASTVAATSTPAAASSSAVAPAAPADQDIAAHHAAPEPALTTSQSASQAASADPVATAAPASAPDAVAGAAPDAAPPLTVWPNLKAAKQALVPLMASAGSAPLGRIRPRLDDAERLAARQQAAALRGIPPAAAAGAATAAASAPASPPVFAVVVRPRRFRQTAADDLKVLKSAVTKLSGTVPAHGELLNKDGAWHAAWWPFDNQVDAERARMLLAGRGLKADIVEF